MNQKTTLGRLPREAIRTVELPVITAELVYGYRPLVDVTGTRFNAVNGPGIIGVMAACTLAPGKPRNFNDRL